MKHKNQKFQSLLTTLVLTLFLSGGLTLPGIAPGRPIPKEPPVEEEGPEEDEGDGIQPLSDLDKPVTKVEK